jgi:hypothetical protein
MAGHGRRAKDSIQGNWGIPGRQHGLCRCCNCLHSESTLITSVDSISASTADDPYTVYLVIRWNCRAGSNGCHKEYNRIRSFRFFFGIIRHGHYIVRCRTSWNFFSSFLSWLMLKGRKLILWLHVEGVTLTVSTFHPMPIEKDPAG